MNPPKPGGLCQRRASKCNAVSHQRRNAGIDNGAVHRLTSEMRGRLLTLRHEAESYAVPDSRGLQRPAQTSLVPAVRAGARVLAFLGPDRGRGGGLAGL